MTFTQDQLETAMAACLAGETPSDLATQLAMAMTPADLECLVPYLSQGPQPDGFFEYWTHKGKKTMNGFYAMLDMFSALVHAQGQAGVERLAPHLGPQTPFLERVLVLATDERFSRDIVAQYLAGDPDAAPESDSPSQTQEPVPVSQPQALQQGDVEWELAGESTLMARITTDTGQPVIWLSLTNGLSPIDDVRLYLRISEDAQPSASPRLHPDESWKQARLIEEVVELDGQYWLKDALPEHSPTDERPWTATFTLPFESPQQGRVIQIMIVDPAEWDAEGEPQGLRNSVVIGDWWKA